MGEIFQENITFDQLGLTGDLLRGVSEAGFKHPTIIQAKLIPAVLSGSDVIGQAKTGTGKTAAFGLPILQKADPSTPMQTLILVPTRELASQVTAELNELAKPTPIRAVCIVGGESMREQVRSVQKGCQIIVGTPGRVMDLHERQEIHFQNIRFVVLDEVDRMLDIGFREDIRKILKLVKREHQTIFCSATIDSEIEKLARSYMKPDAVKIQALSGSLTVSMVDQRYLPVQKWDKRSLLFHLLTHEEPDTTVVFCRTKATVDRVARFLRDKGINALEIHGDLAQNKRKRVMDSFREKKLAVLVASDLAARGLDIEHISHVINYDLPDDTEVYIHRIGRTARAGRKGVAWSFVTPDQGQLLTEIEKLSGALIEKLDYPDFKPGPIPADAAKDQPKVRTISNPMQALASRTTPDATHSVSKEELARMFPGGVIPKSAPPAASGLGRKFRTKR